MSTPEKVNSVSTLPYSLRIAAGATQLDNIRIVHINYKIPTRKAVFVLRYGNWEDRLLKKAISTLNEDIRMTQIVWKSTEIHMWNIADVIENPLFVTLNMHYKFIEKI